MTREQIQAKLLTYATIYKWPDMTVGEWWLDEKYTWKLFINYAPDVLLLEAWRHLQARNLADQLIAG